MINRPIWFMAVGEHSQTNEIFISNMLNIPNNKNINLHRWAKNYEITKDHEKCFI